MKKCFLVMEGIYEDEVYVRFFETKESAIAHFDNRYYGYSMFSHARKASPNGLKVIKTAHTFSDDGFWASLYEVKRGRYVPRRRNKV